MKVYKRMAAAAVLTVAVAAPTASFASSHACQDGEIVI